MFILPLLVLVCTYVSTIITIAKSEQVFRAEVQMRCQRSAPDLNRRRLIHRAKMKSLRISVVIVMAFIICWTPYYTMMIIFMFMDPGKPESDDLQEAIFFFGSSNSLVNPLIYGAFHLWPSRKRKRNTSSRYSNRDNSLNRRSTVTNATIMRVNTATVRVKGPASPEEEVLVLVEESPYSGNNNHNARSMKKHHVSDPIQHNHNPGLNSTRTFASKVLLRCSEVLSNNTTKL
uniref:Putative gonadotropin-releasing hormone receptor isoform x2 n=1 Tax=Xenopsylla cheopis TaxID=163159 RepID=A0A6M2E0M4_XENCH